MTNFLISHPLLVLTLAFVVPWLHCGVAAAYTLQMFAPDELPAMRRRDRLMMILDGPIGILHAILIIRDRRAGR